MKKHLLSFVLMALTLTASAQALHIFHDGSSTPDVVANGGIDSIYYAPKFLGSTEYQQVLVTKEGEKRYDVVDSVKFNLPHLVAMRHSYFVPNDEPWNCNLFIEVLSSDATPPLLIRADGTQIAAPNHRFSKNTGHIYSWDFWLEPYSTPHTEKWYIDNGENRDSIVMHYNGLPFSRFTYNNSIFPAEETYHTIEVNWPKCEVLDDVRFSWGPFEGFELYYNEDGNLVIHMPKNETGSIRRAQMDLSAGGCRRRFVTISQSFTPFIHSSEEHMNALRDFCDSTNFAEWGKDTNWWSDDPFWEWGYFVNQSLYGGHRWYINDHIASLTFSGGDWHDEINGTLPASFEVFMDDVHDKEPEYNMDDRLDPNDTLGIRYYKGDLSLSFLALHGKIPYNIRHHKKWSKFGWDFIMQNPLYGGFDMEDINLRIDSVEVEDFVNGIKSNTYDMLKKNKITWVLNAGGTIPYYIKGIKDEYVNKYLDYCDKGLGMIATVADMGETYDNYYNYVLGQQNINNLPKDIVWTKGFDKGVGDLSMGVGLGNMSILDSEGNLLWFKIFISGLLDSDFNKLYMEPVDSVCRKYLGEPSEHEPYVSTHYRSTDYSHDGEVLTLQTATVGKGIDLVFMGDMYVDTTLVAGGQYEQDMQASMEYFFEVEPYKSLRNRFNVYAVKAVSPNGYDGIEHKFNYNNELIFKYAQKVPNVDMDHVAIAVIWNNKSMILHGETAMWESGSSIAFIEQGGPSHVIAHETGGHGIAKLLDEYIYSGYEDNHTQDGANEEFREWIKTNYHDKGWGMNISATDNPNEVPWAHFLKDERYKDEVGIYQGAWYWPEELWRSSETSIMKDGNYLWFNAPSREAIYKTVMQLSEGEGWNYDYEKFVEFDAPIRDVNKRAMAKRGAGNELNTDQRRVELRPPTIYKGSWRDAGKPEKVTSASVPEKYSSPQPGKTSPKRPVRIAQYDNEKMTLKPYYVYKRERMEVAP